MKYLISCPLSWALYWIGDLFSKICNNWPENPKYENAEYKDLPLVWRFAYQGYQKTMIWSGDIQEWAGGKYGPWEVV